MPADDLRPFVVDVSRLVWRLWSGRLPTGIDRVCLAYADRYAPRGLAMVQRGRLRLVLGSRHSDALFALLAGQVGTLRFRAGLIRVLAAAFAAQRRQDHSGRIYLNVGHTGLNAADLGRWLRRRGLRSVVLVHDLIPITHPEFCRPGEAARHRLRMLAVLDWADGIITNSAATRDDLAAFAERCGRTLPETVVACLGAEPAVESGPIALPDRPTFVAVGTIEARKNHIFLLRLWRQLAARQGTATPVLVLIGQRGWEAADAFALLDNPGPLKDHVVELGTCSDEALRGHLKGARALLMPSLVEGYGLPVAEALALGTPVIATDLRVYREFAGDIPLYLPPSDLARWDEAITDFSEPECAERSRQIALAASYRAPSWSEHFAAVDAWLGRFGV